MENVNYEQLWDDMCFSQKKNWIKIGNIKDCSAVKIAGFDVMPGKQLEQKFFIKNANKRKISTLTLIFGKMT